MGVFNPVMFNLRSNRVDYLSPSKGRESANQTWVLWTRLEHPTCVSISSSVSSPWYGDSVSLVSPLRTRWLSLAITSGKTSPPPSAWTGDGQYSSSPEPTLYSSQEGEGSAQVWSLTGLSWSSSLPADGIVQSSGSTRYTNRQSILNSGVLFKQHLAHTFWRLRGAVSDWPLYSAPVVTSACVSPGLAVGLDVVIGLSRNWIIGEPETFFH